MKFIDIIKSLFDKLKKNMKTATEEIKVIPETKVYGITQEELRHRILVYNSLITSNPYRNDNKLSQWSVIGSFSNWKEDVPMFTVDHFSSFHICKALKLEAGDELKLRCKHSWMINLGSDAPFVPGSPVHLIKNGQNIKIEESGIYDIELHTVGYLDIFPTKVHLDDIPEGMELWYNERNKMRDEAFRLRSLRDGWIRFSTNFPEEFKLTVELPEVEDYDGDFIKYKDRLSRDWKNLNSPYINSEPK